MKKAMLYAGTCLFTLFFCSCKKDSTVETRTATINGSVLNLCTNQLMANIRVSLITKGPEGSSSQDALSDAAGNFSFANASISMSPDYSYHIYIESKSGIGSGPEIGFDGVDVTIDKNALGHFFMLGVVPHFKSWSFYFPSGISLTAADTVLLTIQQNVFHANVPQNANYMLTLMNSPQYTFTPGNYIGTSGNYWMGWWHSTLDRVQNGVHIIKTDSFYIDWGATKTDTIPF